MPLSYTEDCKTVSDLYVNSGNVVVSDSCSVNMTPFILLNHLHGFGTLHQKSARCQPHSPGPGLPALDNGYDVS